MKSSQRKRRKEKVSEMGRATAVLNALETQRKKEYNGLSGRVLVWFTVAFYSQKQEHRPFWQIFHTDPNQLQADSFIPWTSFVNQWKPC